MKPGVASLERLRDGLAGRGLAVFGGAVLAALVLVTLYGMLDRGLFGEERWLPVAAGLLSLALVTLFVNGYYAAVPRVGWVLAGLLAVLVLVKGLSMVWTVSEGDTLRELLRSSMYLAVFAVTLAAVASRRHVSLLADGAVLTTAVLAAYGMLQRIDPVEYPITSFDGVRITSTLEYANTAALVFAMGVVLGLGRMSGMRVPLLRGLYAALVLLAGAALFFTFSRGAALALAVALVAQFVLSSNRLQVFTNLLLVSGPLLWLVYRAQSHEALFQSGAEDPARLAAGSALQTDLLLALGAAFLLQTVYGTLAAYLDPSPGVRRVLGAVVLGVVALAAGVGAHAAVDRVGAQEVSSAFGEGTGIGERMTSVDSLRYQYWQVGWEAWKDQPLTGTGAGTFSYTWFQDRPETTGVQQVHNLYLEQGTETGIFAFAALAGFTFLLAGYTALASLRAEPGPRRTLLAGLVAALVVYLTSSALEWHWYIPPSTIFFFLLAAAAVKYASAPEWDHPEKPRAVGDAPEREESPGSVRSPQDASSQ